MVRDGCEVTQIDYGLEATKEKGGAAMAVPPTQGISRLSRVRAGCEAVCPASRIKPYLSLIHI